jgi:hypothetical protein
LRPFKKSIFVVLISLCVSLMTSCSGESSIKTIRATLFLLDGSKSLASTDNFSTKEQQLKERLTFAFKRNEAIYFDFIRNDYSKQEILPLISMKSILNVNNEIVRYAKNKDVRKETDELVSNLWSQALLDSKSVDVCIRDVAAKLDTEAVNSWGTKVVAQNLCIGANKAKETFSRIKVISSGQILDNGYIGSDVESAFEKGFGVLESLSRNLTNSEGLQVSVQATIVVSSDMMQRKSSGEKVIDVIRNMSDEEISDYILKVKGESQLRNITPNVLIDGWANTKKNYSEKDRDTLEAYWKKWFEHIGANEPDFGFGVIDWSVDQ